MSASDYADFLLAEELARSDFDAFCGNEWHDENELSNYLRSAAVTAFARYGYFVGTQFDEEADDYAPWLASKGALIKEGDEYTGYYYKLRIPQKNKAIEDYLANHATANRIRKLRADALPRALKRLAEENGWPASPDHADVQTVSPASWMPIPASDRIVSIGHNAANSIIEATDELIAGLSAENSIDGDSDMRSRYLGQLNASRELVRSQSIRMYLLYESAVGVLNSLIKRYKDQAIAEAAKKLLGLLIEKVFNS